METILYSKAIIAAKKDGTEPFIKGNCRNGLCLQDFWRWAYSDILCNSSRGKLAEFIVASAIDAHYGIRNEWDPYDLVTKSGRRLEIKSSGYIQSWNQKSKSKIAFGIQPTQKWDEETGCYEAAIKRQSDLYVFSVLAHQDPNSVNPLNVDQWEFYILPTSILDREKKNQKTITFKSLLKLNPVFVEFGKLAEVIEEIVL